MKKLICLALLICLSLTSCNFSLKKQENPVPLSDFLGYLMPKPDDWIYDFWIGDSLSGVDIYQYQVAQGGGGFYGRSPSENSSEYIRYNQTAFFSGEHLYSYVHVIEITDPGVVIYGLSLNSDINEWFLLLEGMGYVMSKKYDIGSQSVSGRRDCFRISITNYTDEKYKLVGRIWLYHDIPHAPEIIN